MFDIIIHRSRWTQCHGVWPRIAAASVDYCIKDGVFPRALAFIGRDYATPMIQRNYRLAPKWGPAGRIDREADVIIDAKHRADGEAWAMHPIAPHMDVQGARTSIAGSCRAKLRAYCP